MAVGSDSPYSLSVQRALDWAGAVARVRERTPPSAEPPPVQPSDLFVGALLAHADADGEVRVLLDHFGLTARDVVGEAYARITPTTLAAALPHVSPGAQSPDGPGLSEILGMAARYSGGQAQLVHVLGGMLTAKTDLLTRLEEVFAGIGESRPAVATSYEEWLRSQPQSQGVAGKLLREWLLRRNPRTPVSVAGFATDDVTGLTLSQQDMVGISPESNALAYLVASRDLAPPLAIGLFGDWGSGKSFLMRDVRARVDRLVELCKEQQQHDAAVWKNIQHVDFNAWEYVQGDLWAALLEKVFRTLDTRVRAPSLVTERRAPIRLELERAAERELRRLGHHVHRRTRAGRPDGVGIETLTERERQVARLVVDRNTNPEIAAELFLSPKTVETHIRNMFRKLDVVSRVEIARAIERADREVRAPSQ
jgi:DNA-binding CsgD family transcriptional regulator